MGKYNSASPYIASFVILRNKNKVAMLLRKNTGWMDGHFGLPAGKVEWGEPFSVAAIREGLEEIGVVIKLENIVQKHTAHRHSEDTDWVDVYFEVTEWEGEPINAEPNKSERLEWIDPNDKNVKIVPSQRVVLEEIYKGNHYSEFGW